MVGSLTPLVRDPQYIHIEEEGRGRGRGIKENNNKAVITAAHDVRILLHQGPDSQEPKNLRSTSKETFQNLTDF